MEIEVCKSGTVTSLVITMFSRSSGLSPNTAIALKNLKQVQYYDRLLSGKFRTDLNLGCRTLCNLNY